MSKSELTQNDIEQDLAYLIGDYIDLLKDKGIGKDEIISALTNEVENQF